MGDAMITQEEHDEATEILARMKEDMDRLDHIIRHSGEKMAYERWKAYPKGHILMALDNDHPYLGKNAFTVDDIISSLDVEGENEEDADDDTDSDSESE